MGVGEHDNFAVADDVDEVVGELAEMSGADHWTAPPAAVRRRRGRPLEEQLGSSLRYVRELVAELAAPIRR